MLRLRPVKHRLQRLPLHLRSRLPLRLRRHNRNSRRKPLKLSLPSRHLRRLARNRPPSRLSFPLER